MCDSKYYSVLIQVNSKLPKTLSLHAKLKSGGVMYNNQIGSLRHTKLLYNSM